MFTRSKYRWVMQIFLFTACSLFFQNCGGKYSTTTKPDSESQTSQGSTSPDSGASRVPTATPAPTPTPAPVALPNPAPGPSPLPSPNSPNPAPTPGSTPGSTPDPNAINPNQSGDTTLQQALQYPTDSHFIGARWAGVFDPRVTGTAQYAPTSWADVSAVGQGRCISSDMINTAGDGTRYATVYWYFTNNKFDGNEALTTLRINPGETVVYKVILPPGTTESTVSDQAGLWGNVWTQSTGRNLAPQSANWQSYGGFNPLVSTPGRAANAVFIATQPLSQETYGVLWFQHRGEGDNRVIAVKELIVNLTIKDFNLYNQWIQRTTGLRCL